MSEQEADIEFLSDPKELSGLFHDGKLDPELVMGKYLLAIDECTHQFTSIRHGFNGSDFEIYGLDQQWHPIDSNWAGRFVVNAILTLQLSNG